MKKNLIFFLIFGGIMFLSAEASVKSENMALIVIDIQKDYFPAGLNEMSGSEKAVIKAKNVIDYFRKKGIEVILIKHISESADAKYFKPDTIGIEFHPLAVPAANEKIIIKHKVSSYQDTDLQKYLESKKIKKLVIIGMQTNVCITKAAEESVKLGYKVFIIKDACAAKSAEIHNDRIAKLGEIASIIDSSEIKKLF